MATALERIVAAGRAGWPDLSLSDGVFVEHLARHVNDATTFEVAFAPDLYLACACTHGVSGAAEAFKRRFSEEIRRGFAKMKATADEREEASQRLFEKLLTAPPERRPKIADYAGSGPLALWVRVTALRTLHNVVVRKPKETSLETQLFDTLPTGLEDPELAHMREVYRAEFRAAFEDGIRNLSAADRALLTQRFIGRLTQAQLAKAYGVHVNTAARWLTKALERLEAEVRGLLLARLKVEEEELHSILRLVRSQIDVSLGPLQEETAHGPE